MSAETTPQAVPFTALFTGLPGSGKSTLAALVAHALTQLGRRVQILDGEQVRATLSRDLGFDRDGRRTQAERLAFLASLLNQHGVDVLVAAIVPYAADRRIIAEQVERFAEVAVVCEPQVCRERDVEGWYARADGGELSQFTGVSDPYEAPVSPLTAVLNDAGGPEQGAMVILEALQGADLISGVEKVDLGAAAGYSAEDEAEITKRLGDLGYL
jgi:adenylylsulfate kinase